MNKLKTIKKELDILEKKLINYLEAKRVDFPRFYFVSNDDLIDILSAGKGMKTLQPHLGKLFEAIKYLVTDELESSVSGMISPEGEHVTFLNLLSIGSDNNVNELLKNIERGMIENVRTFIKIAFE